MKIYGSVTTTLDKDLEIEHFVFTIWIILLKRDKRGGVSGQLVVDV